MIRGARWLSVLESFRLWEGNLRVQKSSVKISVDHPDMTEDGLTWTLTEKQNKSLLIEISNIRG